ncbi:hypothetical protein [Dialister invisus]|uniref:hypothetical protein n=1 Tax=Dialister invisus TaxID=218538 RepID=UPI002657B83F|nr:hypothetical protein [Dialister invisus]
MKKLTESKLLAGFIYGDHHTKEYIFLPGSELGADIPILVYETEEGRRDLSMDDALKIIEKRSLKLTAHPIFGKRTL